MIFFSRKNIGVLALAGVSNLAFAVDLGTLSYEPAVSHVPTLTGWGTLIIILLMAFAAYLVLRPRMNSSILSSIVMVGLMLVGATAILRPQVAMAQYGCLPNPNSEVSMNNPNGGIATLNGRYNRVFPDGSAGAVTYSGCLPTDVETLDFASFTITNNSGVVQKITEKKYFFTDDTPATNSDGRTVVENLDPNINWCQVGDIMAPGDSCKMAIVAWYYPVG